MEYDLTLESILKHPTTKKKYIDNETYNIWRIVYSFKNHTYTLINRDNVYIFNAFSNPNKVKFRETN